MSHQDHYTLLEVHPKARQGVIKAAYGAIIKTNHPDRGGNARIAGDLGEAYAILGNEERRAKYDREQSDLLGSLLGGEYQILELVSDTGLGAIYRAEEVLTGQTVCVKHLTQISPQAAEIFLDEARALRSLRHFGIPSVFRIFQIPDGSIAFAMSWIPGKTLEEVAKTPENRDPEHIAWVTERTLNTLRYMHYYGAIHGDIKPQKVMLDQKHEAVLVGFGLALVRPETEEIAKGYTPYFSPPEAREGKQLWPQSDMYSLGMTMIYGLSGDLAAVEKKWIPRSTPEPLREFIQKLVLEDIARRPRWEEGDLFEEIQKIRIRSFKRARSGMKHVVGL